MFADPSCMIATMFTASGVPPRRLNGIAISKKPAVVVPKSASTASVETELVPQPRNPLEYRSMLVSLVAQNR